MVIQLSFVSFSLICVINFSYMLNNESFVRCMYCEYFPVNVCIMVLYKDQKGLTSIESSLSNFFQRKKPFPRRKLFSAMLSSKSFVLSTSILMSLFHLIFNVNKDYFFHHDILGSLEKTVISTEYINTFVKSELTVYMNLLLQSIC